jgi:hypothetical protein
MRRRRSRRQLAGEVHPMRAPLQSQSLVYFKQCSISYEILPLAFHCFLLMSFLIFGKQRAVCSHQSPMVQTAAVEIAGGPTAVARLCGVRRQSIYLWIKEWRVERLVDALKLSHASGIPVEKFAGEIFEPERSKETK